MLSRNLRVPTPSVLSAILPAPLYSLLPPSSPRHSILRRGEVRESKSIVIRLSFRPHRAGKTFTAMHVLCYSEGLVLDRQSTSRKGRKRFLPRFTATQNQVTIVNGQHTLSFSKVLGFTFQKCFKYSEDRLGETRAVSMDAKVHHC